MNYLLQCQEFIIKPCQTMLCKGLVTGGVVLAFIITIICMIGLLSGEYQKRERERLKNVHWIRRKKK